MPVSKKWQRALRTLFIASSTIAAALVLTFAPIVGQPLYNYLLFYPVKFPGGYYEEVNANNIQPENIYFRSDNGNTLHGLMYKLPGAKKIMLFSHGNFGNVSYKAYLVERLLKAGTSVFTYDYSGYGRSEGKPSLGGLYDDGHGAYKYLINHEYYGPEQIILFGESLGTVVAGKLAASCYCAGAILECPLYSVQRVGCDTLPFLKLYPDWAWSENCKALNNALVLGKKHPPVLMVAGTADMITRIEQSDELYEAIAEPKQYVRVDGAYHGDDVMQSSPAYSKAVKTFLASLK